MPHVSDAISIVIPVYKSEAYLPALFQELKRAISSMPGNVEVILVSDGSPDRSWDEIKREAQSTSLRIRAIRLAKNFGQHNATLCGIKHARGDIVVTMDDDLQTPPSEIQALVRALRDGNFDLVYARYKTKRHSPLKNAGSFLIGRIFRNLFGIKVRPTSFRAMRRSVCDALNPYNHSHIFLDGLLLWTTNNIGSVETRHAPREGSGSTYSFRKLVSLAFNLIFTFSTTPIRIFTITGFVIAAMAAIYSIFMIYQKLAYNAISPGFTSLIVAIMLLGGVQLCAIGVIGEYVGRIILGVSNRPQFVIREEIRSETRGV